MIVLSHSTEGKKQTKNMADVSMAMVAILSGEIKSKQNILVILSSEIFPPIKSVKNSELITGYFNIKLEIMEEPTTRKERRRRRAERKMEENMTSGNQKKVENMESSSDIRMTEQSQRKLVRRDTYTVFKSKSDLNVSFTQEADWNVSSVEEKFSKNESSDSRNLTYNLNKNANESRNETYSIEKPEDSGKLRPIPAPRKDKSQLKEPEQLSSDTDKDITEIDLDEIKINSDREPKDSSTSSRRVLFKNSRSDDSGDGLVVAPVPKPRKLTTISQSIEETVIQQQQNETLIKSKLVESLKDNDNEEDSADEERYNDNEGGEPPHQAPIESNELPLLEYLQDQKSQQSETDFKDKSKVKRKHFKISDLVDRKGKKKKSSKMFSSVIKSERAKLPKISSILKELKEDEKKTNKTEDEEDKTEFQFESPRYPQSSQNGQIYVQNKNGFYVMEREQVLRNGNPNSKGGENNGTMEDSTIRTAILFQKYWSRSMMYFHGILAGFALSHAATVTAIMHHYNYQPSGFVSIYSCLSLKIHFIFYTLTAFCIISCFDRIDIGHINRKHWESAWKVPSMWIILCIYVISFALTFANQKTEARFDTYFYGNETEGKIWQTQVQSDIQVSLLTWYHTIWARDMLVLFAWFMISLTKFTDFLQNHLNNMVKYAEVKSEEEKLQTLKTDYV